MDIETRELAHAINGLFLHSGIDTPLDTHRIYEINYSDKWIQYHKAGHSMNDAELDQAINDDRINWR